MTVLVSAESLLRPLVVVLTPPGLDDNLRMGETGKPMLVEALVAEAAIE